MNDRQLRRSLRLAASSAAALTLASAAPAQQAEPLIWTEFADPDPHFVAPPEPRAPARSKNRLARTRADTRDQAAYEAGRSVAEASMLLEAAACRAIKDAGTPLAQAPAWARNCPP